MTVRPIWCGVAAALAMSAPLRAQSVSSRMAAIRNEVVTFHFAARDGVCGDGEHFIRSGRSSYHGSYPGRSSIAPCVFGPVQVRLTVNDGVVTRVQTWVGPLRRHEARELGAVPAAEAARYLLTVAARGIPAASAKAIFPAVLADSASVWPDLLAIAKNTEARSGSTRRDALFWLSRFASGALYGRANDPFVEDESRSADDDLKSHAVFVLSQLPRDSGIAELLEVARSNPNRRVRSQAFFWLGQSGDARAIALFESVLRS